MPLHQFEIRSLDCTHTRPHRCIVPELVASRHFVALWGHLSLSESHIRDFLDLKGPEKLGRGAHRLKTHESAVKGLQISKVASNQVCTTHKSPHGEKPPMLDDFQPCRDALVLVINLTSTLYSDSTTLFVPHSMQKQGF